MLFLIVLEALLLAVIVILVRQLQHRSLKAPLRTAFGREHMALAAGLIAGTIGLVSVLGMFTPPTIRIDTTNFTPWFVLACGLFCAVGFGLRLATLGRRLHSSQSSGLQWSLPFGTSAAAVAASVYLAFTALDHWWFFRGEVAGVAAPQLIEVDDISCGLVLFRLTEHDAQYRCPTAVMFNELYSEPFLPWPQYKSGRSALLKEKYEELLRSERG